MRKTNVNSREIHADKVTCLLFYRKLLFYAFEIRSSKLSKLIRSLLIKIVKLINLYYIDDSLDVNKSIFTI